MWLFDESSNHSLIKYARKFVDQTEALVAALTARLARRVGPRAVSLGVWPALPPGTVQAGESSAWQACSGCSATNCRRAASIPCGHCAEVRALHEKCTPNVKQICEQSLRNVWFLFSTYDLLVEADD